jgi:hypothetical protein
VSDERAGIYLRAERTKWSIAKEEYFLGTLSPDPWDFIAVDANPS